MVFSGSFFLCGFLPVLIVLYFLCNKLSYRNILLLFASLLFYAWGEPRNVILLLGSIVFNFFAAYAVNSLKPSKGKCARTALVLSVIVNCGALFIYKYLNFSIDNINAVLRLIYGNSAPVLARTAVELPIGISFFTFQALSYVIDVYRGTAAVQTSIFNFGLYLSFFPQLIAGPIVRYQTIADQISDRSVTIEDFSQGARRFVLGLSKKVLIANTVAAVADNSFGLIGGFTISIKAAWLGALCYMLQIYFDFSGYSDMAIGLGRIFGFRFLENFNYPYSASTVTDFWRRWHISLSSWFRDYVYIPLGGSRVGKGRLFLNLLVVWLLTGVWHGANWTFICWGLIYFLLLVFEKFSGIGAYLDRHRWSALVYRGFTLLCVLLCWVLFRSDNILLAGKYIRCMFSLQAAAPREGVYFTKRYYCFIAMSFLFSFPLLPELRRRLEARIPQAAIKIIGSGVSLLLLLLSLSTAVSSTYNPFIYFNF